jgi:hypothetical protein
MMKIRGKPKISRFLELSKVRDDDTVILENGMTCKVISAPGFPHEDLPTISVTVPGYGTAQYFTHNGEHIFGKCSTIKSAVAKVSAV